MRLFSYKMTHDTGFAPNPFGQTLTLATCKPEIRRCKIKGDWIAGFTSGKLASDKVGRERLVYLMRVGQKLHFRDYFYDSRFQDKIPKIAERGPLAKVGDNIYRPLDKFSFLYTQFEQLENPNHWDGDKPGMFHQKRDISGQFILVADRFYYFGRDALYIDQSKRPLIPKGQSSQGWLTKGEQARVFIESISNKYRSGRHGFPHQWPDDEVVNADFFRTKSCV